MTRTQNARLAGITFLVDIATGITAQAFGAYLMRGEAGTGAIFFAVASTLFAWLMQRGRMIPAVLARLGVAASARCRGRRRSPGSCGCRCWCTRCGSRGG